MKSCYDVGGYIKGTPKVMGDSPKNDVIDGKLSPGEIVLKRTVVAAGPKAWNSFIMDQLKENDPDLYKTHYDQGGMVNANYQGLQDYFNPPGDPAVPAQSANIVKPNDERLRQLDAVQKNIRPLNSTEQMEYNTLKAKQSQNFSDGGMVKGYNQGGAVAWDAAPPSKEELSQKWDSAPPKPEELSGMKMEAPKSSMGDKAQTALENFGNATTLGYLPQIQAATAPAVNKVMDVILDEKSDPSTYVQRRDENIKRIAEESKENPKSAMGGTAAGLVAGAALTPELGVIKGAGVLPSMGRGALMGAGYGAAQNPGDKPGVIDPIQAGERLENTKTGAIIGAPLGAAGAIVGKGIGALKNSADAAQEFANSQAVKASGGMLKDFRTLNAKGRLDDVGQFALDKGIVSAGDSVDKVAQKANAIREQAGDKLDKIYSKVRGVFGEPDYMEPGFNPARDSDEIISSVKQKLGDSPEATSTLNKVKSYLDDLELKHGDQVLDPKVANNIKTDIDKSINYNRNPFAKGSAYEDAMSEMRNIINGKVADHVDYLANQAGDPELSANLKSANKEYGYAKQLQNMAEDRVNRDAANRMFGLTDTIAGGAGAMAGAVEGAALGHPVEGAVAGLVAAPINKALRTYGPSTMAAAANKAAPMLEKTVVPVSEFLSRSPKDFATKAALQEIMLNRKRGK